MSSPPPAESRTESGAGRVPSPRRRLLLGCGALVVLLGITLAIWTRDEAPPDLSDLDRQFHLKELTGAPTVVDGIDALLRKAPAIPPRLEALEIELRFSFTPSRLAAIPEAARQDPALRASLRAFHRTVRALLPDLAESLDRSEFGIEVVDPFLFRHDVLEFWNYLEVERALAVAAHLAGDTEEASQ